MVGFRISPLPSKTGRGFSEDLPGSCQALPGPTEGGAQPAGPPPSSSSRSQESLVFLLVHNFLAVGSLQLLRYGDVGVRPTALGREFAPPSPHPGLASQSGLRHEDYSNFLPKSNFRQWIPGSTGRVTCIAFVESPAVQM